jgi:hypothetical protein
MVIKMKEDRIHVQNLEKEVMELKENALKVDEEYNKSKEKHELMPKLIDTLDSNIREELEKMWEEVMQEMDERMERMRREMDEKLIPIGFIYSQFPGQPEPGILWPHFQWQDMSPQFSGLFFRVLGQGSDLMGRVQQENSPRLSSVSYQQGMDQISLIELIPGVKSMRLFSGGTSGDYGSHSFNVSGGEVRPKNMAFKLYKRIK